MCLLKIQGYFYQLSVVYPKSFVFPVKRLFMYRKRAPDLPLQLCTVVWVSRSHCVSNNKKISRVSKELFVSGKMLFMYCKRALDCLASSVVYSLAEYRLFYRALLQKRPIILRSLLIALPLQLCEVVKVSLCRCTGSKQNQWCIRRALYFP